MRTYEHVKRRRDGWTDGLMDMTKLIGALCDYENANKKMTKVTGA
jgi:hypothetical protein